MNLWIGLIAMLSGYLFGSISFARWVASRFAPGTDISHIQQPIPNTNITFESDSVSASAVRMHIGSRYGCLTAILDMLKVAIPTLAFKLWQPETPYFLIAAAFGLIGHDWPIFYRFQGGRGESAIIGGMLVIDPVGLLVTNLVGSFLGWLTGELLVLRWSFLILLIPWFWLRTEGLAFVIYAVVVNMIYWFTMFPELKQFFQIIKSGGLSTQEELAGDLAMGKRLGHFLDRYGGPSLLRRLLRFPKSSAS